MKRRVEKNHFMYLLLALAIFFILVCSILFGTIRTVAASSSDVPYKYYTSIRIEEGDTLWSIADTYYDPSYEEITSYIEEVRSMNHLLSEDDIHAGQYLTIPYYSGSF